MRAAVVSEQPAVRNDVRRSILPPFRGDTKTTPYSMRSSGVLRLFLRASRHRSMGRFPICSFTPAGATPNNTDANPGTPAALLSLARHCWAPILEPM